MKKTQASKWKLWLLGGVAVWIAIGSIQYSRDKQKIEAANRAQKVKVNTYQKTPAYRAKVKAQQQQAHALVVQQQQNTALQVKADAEAAKGKRAPMASTIRLLNESGEGELFDGLAIAGDTLQVRTTSTFDVLPYRIRLQHAQTLFKIWSVVAKDKRKNPDTVREDMDIRDAANNQVGTGSAFAEVWVVDQ